MVHVAIYSHRYGTDVKVFDTENAAYKWGKDIAKEYWRDLTNDAMPENEDSLFIEYFNRASEYGLKGESFEIIESPIYREGEDYV